VTTTGNETPTPNEIARNTTRQTAIHIVVGVLLGVLAAAVGLLPWIITGSQLPLQNLWDTNTLPADMPTVMLPFSQYALTFIVALIVIGSALGGGIARARRVIHPRTAVWSLAVGVLAVQIPALIQTTTTVSNGLGDSPESDIYLTALIAVNLVAIVVGLLVLVLLALAPVPGAAIALGLAAVALGPWLSGLALPLNSVGTQTNFTALGIVRWVPAVVVGFAMAWSGFRTLGRAIATVTTLLALWIGPSLFTAISAAAGTRVLASRPAEMAQYGAEIFQSVVRTSESLRPLLVAIIVMIVGLGIGWMTRRRHSPPAELVS
jgi:hypothetical protein